MGVARAAHAAGMLLRTAGARARREAAEILLLAAVYAAVGRLGLMADAVSGFATLLWAPSGIALAALLLRGERLWPGIALGAFVANAWNGAPVAAACAIAAGNTLEGVLGAAALRRLDFRTALDRVRDVLALAGAAVPTTMVSATLGVASLHLAGVVAPGAFAMTWRAWWLGDLASELIVAPLLLTLATSPAARGGARRSGEVATLALSTAGAWVLVFGAPIAGTALQKAYLFFPPLIWAALRFDQRAVAVAALSVAASAAVGTALGLGPFADGALHSSLMDLQVFLIVLAGTSLVLGAAVADRRRAEEALREADRRKDGFLGMLSHELRNPLAPIRNALYILDHDDPAGEVARKARAVAARQVTHLTRLVDDLLDVTRIARGKIQLRRSSADLAGIVRETGEDHRAVLAGRGLSLRVAVPPHAVWVHGDATRLSQVIGNLLQNAAKFSPRGKAVDLALAADGGWAEIRVRDEGIGIVPEVLRDLFQPFFQAHRTLSRSEGGLGLGLALAKGLVELHGGSVRATSDGAGRGAEFVVRLPAVTTGARATAVERAAGAAPHRRARVLVVEDDRDVAGSMVQLLELLGHDVELAPDGPTAIARAHSRPPDVLLCDVGLPGMSGYEVARAFRADPALRTTRLVAVTGYALEADRAQAADAGFEHHIAKPADPDELERLLG